MTYRTTDIVAAILAAPTADADGLEAHLRIIFPGITADQLARAYLVALEDKQQEAAGLANQIKAVERLVSGDTTALTDAQGRLGSDLWLAAVQIHPDWSSNDGRRFRWNGEGRPPSPDAMVEWFQTNHPAQAREIERRFGL